MTIFDPMLWLIAVRSLFQHRIRTSLLGAAIAVVTALLVSLAGIYVGMKTTLLVSATTLMSGHVNVAGFYKSTASSSAPVVTQYQKLRDIVQRDVKDLDYVVQRGRGWAKLISDTGSMQVGIGGIDIVNEPGFVKVVQLKEGSLEGLKQPDGLLLFEEQAKKLDVKVGDKLTFSAPTFKGTNNTIDVTVVAIAANIGMLSSWNTYMSDTGLRQLYQLNDETTGALQIYIKDISKVRAVQESLRKAFAAEGFEIMDNDPRPFFTKFDGVNRESWTGQKLDITNWEDETSFVQWFVTILTVAATTVIFVLTVIIGVGIMNVMWISIRERTREIGTLRAVGMQRRSVLAMFVTEGFLLGIMGTTAGVVIGGLASFLLNNAAIKLPKGAQLVLMSEKLIVAPTAGWIVFAIIFITSVITLISLIPSFLAARLKPISAMSHVG
ncbi:MAG: FtsX-like permease family protein [Myxococcales bacterium]|nr:FtsX-like permease family protein [Myxococcales bacterium]